MSIKCPVCDSINLKKIYKGRDRVIEPFLPVGLAELILLRCKSCGMIFLDASGFDMKAIHEAYWKMLIDNTAENCSPQTSVRPESLLNELESRRMTGNLVEIGCGDGKFLKAARERGWKVSGIEISERAADIARLACGGNILSGAFELEGLKFEPGTFDVAVMWGVIEHLKHPREALMAAKELLRKGGMLVIYTPNADSIFHRAGRAFYFSTFGLVRFFMERLIIAMHIMYFSPRVLQVLLSGRGFRIVRVVNVGIDIDFIFKAHKNLWWSNKHFLIAAKAVQKIGHIFSIDSHTIVFAESA